MIRTQTPRCSIYNVLYTQKSAVDAVGLSLNLACAVCLGQILWHKNSLPVHKNNNVCRYLWLKAVCDVAFFMHDALYLLGHLGDMCGDATATLFYKSFDQVDQMLLFMSSLMQLAAIFGKYV
jgi:predicted permease